MKRRNFIFDIFSIGIVSAMSTKLRAVNLNFTPMVRSISTWKTTEANQKAGQMLDKGEYALDAAIAGVAIEEENPKNTTFAYHFLNVLRTVPGQNIATVLEPVSTPIAIPISEALNPRD